MWVDEKYHSSRTEDMWWAGNWESNGVYRFETDLTPGTHSIVLIGSEGCCDGALDIRFNRDN